MQRSWPAILIVDDEHDFVEPLAFYLDRRGFRVRTASSGRECMAEIRARPPDVVVLDLALSGEDGLALSRQIHASAEPGRAPSILFFSGRGTSLDRVLGLELGADDFLEKPASPREILARIHALLRRRGWTPREGRVLRLGAIGIDLGTQTLLRGDGTEDRLSASEFALLRVFLDTPNAVVTRDDVIARAPASEIEAADRAVDGRIARLRAKLEAGDRPVIETVRGVGYRLAGWVAEQLR